MVSCLCLETSKIGNLGVSQSPAHSPGRQHVHRAAQARCSQVLGIGSHAGWSVDRGRPLGRRDWLGCQAAQEQETLSQVFRVTILASFILWEVLNQQSQEPLDPAAQAATLRLGQQSAEKPEGPEAAGPQLLLNDALTSTCFHGSVLCLWATDASGPSGGLPCSALESLPPSLGRPCLPCVPQPRCLSPHRSCRRTRTWSSASSAPCATWRSRSPAAA